MPKLTANFHTDEFLHSGVTWDGLPLNIKDNIRAVAQRLQVVRDIIGLPIQITSGYRTPEHNAKVGGHKNSYHTKGQAADIVVQGMPASRVQHLLKNWSGGLGSYDSFTHIDIGPKRRWGS